MGAFRMGLVWVHPSGKQSLGWFSWAWSLVPWWFKPRNGTIKFKGHSYNQISCPIFTSNSIITIMCTKDVCRLQGFKLKHWAKYIMNLSERNGFLLLGLFCTCCCEFIHVSECLFWKENKATPWLHERMRWRNGLSGLEDGSRSTISKLEGYQKNSPHIPTQSSLRQLHWTIAILLDMKQTGPQRSQLSFLCQITHCACCSAHVPFVYVHDKNLLTVFSVSENNPQQQQVRFIYCPHIELMMFQLTFQVEISH